MANQTVAGLLVSVDGNTVRLRNEIDKAQQKVKEFGRVTRTEMTNAKGSVALLGEELGIRGSRQLGRFITQIEGVGPALATAFNAIAVVSLVANIAIAGRRVYEFFENTRKMAARAAEETAKVIEGFHRSNLEMAIAADKLEDATAKLEKRPENGLKLALDEARLSAFNLQNQLESDLKAIQQLMSGQAASFWQKMLLGFAGGESTISQVDDYKKELDAINATYNAKIVAGESTEYYQKLEKSRAADLAQLQGKYVSKIEDEIKARQRLVELRGTVQQEYEKTGIGGAGSYPEYAKLNERFARAPGQDAGDQTAILSQLKSFRDGMLEQQIRSENSLRLMEAQIANQKAVQSAQDLENRKQAAEAARQAEEKAQREQMTGFEEQLAGIREQHQVSLEEERSFWREKIEETRFDSANFNTILKKLGEEEQQILKANAENAKKQMEANAEVIRQGNERFAKDLAEARKSIEARRQLADENGKGARENVSAGYQNVEEDTAAAVQAGSMSPAQRLTVLKSELQQATQAKLASLQAEMDAQRAASNEYKFLFGEESNEYKNALDEETKNLREMLTEQTKLVADAARQQAALQREAAEQGVSGALNDLRRKGADFGGQIKEEIESAVGDLNDALVKLMTEPRQNRQNLFKDMGKTIFTGIAKTGLQDAEGGLLGLIPGMKGAGKLGTQGNPMWVKSADAAASGAVSGLTGVASGASGSGGSGGLKGFIGTLFGLNGFMADGGPVSPGNYIVGERGPELMSVGSSGYMHSNASLRSALASSGSGSGGGDTHHHWHIDARGAMDPAAVHMAINRAIAKAAPQIAAGAIHANRDMKARRPMQPPA